MKVFMVMPMVALVWLHQQCKASYLLTTEKNYRYARSICHFFLHFSPLLWCGDQLHRSRDASQRGSGMTDRIRWSTMLAKFLRIGMTPWRVLFPSLHGQGKDNWQFEALLDGCWFCWWGFVAGWQMSWTVKCPDSKSHGLTPGCGGVMDFCSSSETTLVLTCQCYCVTVHDLTVCSSAVWKKLLHCSALSTTLDYLSWWNITTQIFKGYFHFLQWISNKEHV